MEGLMASVVALNASPANLVQSMHGPIAGARIGYPNVLHLEIQDSSGGLWRLASQDADWSPEDPAQLVGLVLNRASIGDDGALRCELSNGSTFEVVPRRTEVVDDPPSWEVIAPDGLALEFGPGLRWQVSSAVAPISSRS